MRPIDGNELETLLETAIHNMRVMAIALDIKDDPEVQMEIKAYTDILNGVKEMPTIELSSAQPEITDEQAIEHLQSTVWMQNHDREMYESGLREQLADDSGSYDNLVPCEDARNGSDDMAIKALEQPDPCVDTIDALNESIKHFDDMAEECRINANIERNDYMDMKYDAAEYRQLSIWLNELKWLRERVQSQPEVITCKDCKHNPKSEWFGCPMSHLNEKQRPETAWCWRGERRTDE